MPGPRAPILLIPSYIRALNRFPSASSFNLMLKHEHDDIASKEKVISA